MKVDKKKFGLLSSDIEKYTRVGSFELQRGNLEKACDAFEFAYKRSLQLEEGYTERACALNLGAIYIALNQHAKGLEFLQKAVPPMNKKDQRSNGDLYYNFGIGFEGLSDFDEAARYYELASDEYKSELQTDRNVLLDIYSRLATIYSQQGKHLKAAQSYESVSQQCLGLNLNSNRVQAMASQSTQLVLADEKDRAVAACDSCYDLCQALQDSSDLAKAYNQLGLVYTQCKLYPKAATCFELALPLTRGFRQNSHVEAVVMQNLGAVYNSMGDYQRAISLHEDAASLHGQVGNRSGQGQCFMNLAFAFSQMSDHGSAGDAYNHALQAAKDTGDKICQWQALEGLAGVACIKNDAEKAVTYYKQALSILAVTPGSKTEFQDRIVGKLTDALKEQVAQKSASQRPSIVIKQPSFTPAVANAINSQGGNDNSPNVSKRPVIALAHDHLHAGIGDYLAESDNSLSDRHVRKKKKHLSHKDSGSSGSGKSDNDTRKSDTRMSVTRNDSPEPELTFKKKSNNNNKVRMKRRQQASKEPLLREDHYNSEEEWLERMKMVHGTDSDSSIGEYEERTRAPSVAPPALFNVVKTVQEPRVRAHISESSESESDSERENVRTQMRKNLSRVSGDSDEASGSEGVKVRKSPSFRKISKKALDKSHNVGNNLYTSTPSKQPTFASSVSEENTDIEDDTDAQTNKDIGKSRGKQLVQPKYATVNRTNSQRRKIEDQSMRGKGLTISSSSEDDSDSDGKPPIPTSSPPSTLNATYEDPSVLWQSAKKNTSSPKRNAYMRKLAEYEEDESDLEEGKVTQGTLYTSVKDTGENSESHYNTPPTLPPRNPSQMSRAEREIMMYEYERQHNENKESEILPTRNQRSKTCTIL